MQVGKDVLTMSLPAEMLLPCSELQKQAEEMVRAEQTPTQPKIGTVAEERFVKPRWCS